MTEQKDERDMPAEDESSPDQLDETTNGEEGSEVDVDEADEEPLGGEATTPSGEHPSAEPDGEEADTDGESGEADADSGEDDDELDDLFLDMEESSDGVVEVEVDEESDDEAVSDGEGADVTSAETEQLRGRVDQLEDEVDELEEENERLNERLMRTAADLENFRKRTKREKEELKKYGTDKLALELIPAVDNLERALEHARENESEANIVDGVEMVNKQIKSAFKKHGIEGFDAVGEQFNPEHHEAIQQVESDEHETGEVVEQFQKGYFIYDRLLRPALVSVAKQVTDGDNKDVDESEADSEGDSDPSGEAGASEASEHDASESAEADSDEQADDQSDGGSDGEPSEAARDESNDQE